MRRRILSVLLSFGLVLTLGLPVQAGRIGAVDGAMAAEGMAPSEGCRHCDMQKTVDMAVCHGVCLVMPALLQDDTPVLMSMPRFLHRRGDIHGVRGQSLEPDSGPPKFTCII